MCMLDDHVETPVNITLLFLNYYSNKPFHALLINKMKCKIKMYEILFTV